MMSCYSKQLENDRWGIFIDNQLVASIGCSDTCQRIIDFLEARLQNQNLASSNLASNKASNSIIPYFHNMKLRP